MSSLLDRVNRAIGTATRDFDVPDENATFSQVDEVEARFIFKSNGEIIARAESVGAPLAALSAAHDLIDGLGEVFVRRIAESLISQGATVEDANEAMDELTAQRVEDLLGGATSEQY